VNPFGLDSRRWQCSVAVVQLADDQEASVVLWNRLVLRIPRQDIVLNQQNMRWECEADNA
jgi:hypothetical protein